jgi:hypothetical protein
MREALSRNVQDGPLRFRNQRDHPDCSGYGRGLFFGRELLVPTALAVLAIYSG